jgi:hypothetical protein
VDGMPLAGQPASVVSDRQRLRIRLKPVSFAVYRVR